MLINVGVSQKDIFLEMNAIVKTEVFCIVGCGLCEHIVYNDFRAKCIHCGRQSTVAKICKDYDNAPIDFHSSQSK